MKFVDTKVTFAEIPDEISLCISISGCPIHCPGCHSQYLWEDTGEELTWEVIENLIKANPGITCVCFMGGGNDTGSKIQLMLFAKRLRDEWKLKSAWYTGQTEITISCTSVFDYVKLGPYIAEKGPITKKTTNQRMIMFNHETGIGPSWYAADITYKFWKDEENLEISR